MKTDLTKYFNPDQIKNISLIISKLQTTGEINLIHSGNSFYHFGVQLKDKRWVVFHSETGDITISEELETANDLYNAFYDDEGQRVCEWLLAIYLYEGGHEIVDFAPVDLIVNDINTNNFIK